MLYKCSRMWGVAAVLTCLSLAISSQLVPPLLNMKFASWAENIIFDGKGNMLVSDAVTGIVWRIFLNETINNYQREPHLNVGFDRALGLAITPDGNTLYGAATVSSGNFIIYLASPTVPNQYKTVAKLKKAGNGLAMHFKTGFLYAASEGNFIPGNGEVYEIDPQTGSITSIISSVWAADGAWIDQDRNILYVSEVVLGRVIVYDLMQRKIIQTYKAPLQMLDDMGLSTNGKIMFGADFWNKTIVAFNADGSSSKGTILASGLKSPTSARIGSGFGFRNTSLYVTEGGGVFKSTKDRRVFEIPNVQ